MTNALTKNISPTDFIVEHNVVWYGKSLQSVWVICPGCVLSQLPVHPQIICWWGRTEALKKKKERCPWGCTTDQQHLKLWCVMSTVSVPNRKHSRLWRKLTPSQTQCKGWTCPTATTAVVRGEEPLCQQTYLWRSLICLGMVYHCKHTNQL